jgi:hypothetical protein
MAEARPSRDAAWVVCILSLTKGMAGQTLWLSLKPGILSTLFWAAYNVLYAYITLYVAMYAVCTLLFSEHVTCWVNTSLEVT